MWGLTPMVFASHEIYHFLFNKMPPKYLHATLASFLLWQVLFAMITSFLSVVVALVRGKSIRANFVDISSLSMKPCSYKT